MEGSKVKLDRWAAGIYPRSAIPNGLPSLRFRSDSGIMQFVSHGSRKKSSARCVIILSWLRNRLIGNKVNSPAIGHNQHPFKAAKEIHSDKSRAACSHWNLANSLPGFICDGDHCLLQYDFLQNAVGKAYATHRIRRGKQSYREAYRRRNLDETGKTGVDDSSY